MHCIRQLTVIADIRQIKKKGLKWQIGVRHMLVDATWKGFRNIPNFAIS